MSKKPKFRVAVAGLDLRDVRLIEIVFKHSQYNRYEFLLVDQVAVGDVDLLIANAHDAEGQSAISALRATEVPIPVIAAVPRGESSSSKHAISIDRLTLQLLPILNRVVELDLLSPETEPMTPQVQQSMIDAERLSRLQQAMETRNNVDEFFAAPKARVSETTEHLTRQIAPQPTPSLPPNGSLASKQTPSQTPARAPMHQGAASPQPSPVRAPVAANLVAFPGGKQEGEALRVLVVDDSPTVRQQLGNALEKMGFVVELAASGAEALRKVERSRFDLALVDVVMPEMDGYKLTKELKRDKQRKSMPVIILTSKSSPFDLARGALAGCDSFLSKPVPLKDLQNAIVKHLRKALAIDDLSTLLNLGSPTKAASAPPALRDPRPADVGSNS